MEKVEIEVELVKEAYNAACSEWKGKLEEALPNLFTKRKGPLVIGEWYVWGDDPTCIVCYQGSSNGYGTWRGDWGPWSISSASWVPADKETVMAMLEEQGKDFSIVLDETN